jgi:hypothetical protein
MLPPRTRSLALGFALAAGLLALGAKLSLIRSYGSDVPYYDEWDAIGRALLIPSGVGRLPPGNFLLPQNEHRIVLTRLLSYGLLRANGQWDPLLEMTVGAVLHSAFLVALLLLGRRLATGVWFAAVAVSLTLLFVLPFDWENTLQGVQSQFYFLEWAALGMFLLCAPAPPLSGRWCLGLLVGVIGLGSMSSGFLAAAVLLAMLAVRCVLSRRVGWRDGAAAAFLAALCVAGALAIGHPAREEAVRAHSARQWAAGAATALSWPDLGLPVAFVVLQLPLVALAARCLRERRVGGAESVLLALGAWTWLQVGAIAYGRGSSTMIPSPRYMDLYSLGSAANALALAVLWRPGPGARARALFGVLWASMFACGLWDLGHQAYSKYLDGFPGARAAERRDVRLFLATGDAEALERAKPGELPYPDPRWLDVMLTSAGIRAVLPVGIRPSLPLEPREGSRGFRPAPLAQLQPGASGSVWVARGGPARFESEPLPAGILPFLHFSVAGSPDLGASALRLESAGGPVRGPDIPLRGEDWVPFDLAVPEGPTVRIVVEVPAGDHWLAFSGPVELGGGSWANQRLLRRSGGLERAAALLFAAGLLWLLWSDLRRRPLAGELPS